MDDIFDSLPDNPLRRTSRNLSECREAMSFFGIRDSAIAEESKECEVDSKPVIVGEDVKAKMREILEEMSDDEHDKAHHSTERDDINLSARLDAIDRIVKQVETQQRTLEAKLADDDDLKQLESPFKGSTISINVQSDHDSKFDHTPHDLFIQLNELHGFGDYQEWRETARWIKYEENVEEGADRWGRPHVPSLSFHSLLNVRRCFETGVVMLDVEEKDLPHIVYQTVEMVNFFKHSFLSDC